MGDPFLKMMRYKFALFMPTSRLILLRECTAPAQKIVKVPVIDSIYLNTGFFYKKVSNASSTRLS